LQMIRCIGGTGEQGVLGGKSAAPWCIHAYITIPLPFLIQIFLTWYLFIYNRLLVAVYSGI
jgi:hypothetical protein